MALTPIDIQNKTFSIKMRGYEKEEVDDFMELIVKNYEDTVRRNRELEKALKHAEEKLAYFNELKDALNQSIIVAQDTADKIKKSASRESEVILTSAQNRAEELVVTAEQRAHALTAASEERARSVLTGATETARQLAVETNDLKKKTRVFHNNLLVLLQAQLEQVKSPEWDEILTPFSSYVKDSHEVLRELIAKELDNEVASAVNSEEEAADVLLDAAVVDANAVAPETAE